MKKALITGFGQDTYHLAKFLLGIGYDVHVFMRHVANRDMSLYTDVLPHVTIHLGDILDQSSIDRAMIFVRPDEVYNLAAQSFVPASWECPTYCGESTGLGAVRVLESVRTCHPTARFYQASSSEMFGDVTGNRQNEDTPFRPRSPYGAAKVYAHFSVKVFRESFGLFACSGILFNHESPQRGLQFVTRKITNAVAKIKLGVVPKDYRLQLGNVAAKRDWGHAADYVVAMWTMLQAEVPDDYVVATGEVHSVLEFCQAAFGCVGIDPMEWIEVSNIYTRPADVNYLCGDAAKAHVQLGWHPTYTFEGMVEEMVNADIARVQKELDGKCESV